MIWIGLAIAFVGFCIWNGMHEVANAISDAHEEEGDENDDG